MIRELQTVMPKKRVGESGKEIRLQQRKCLLS